MEPDICTSLQCDPDDYDYCHKCHHAIYKGHGTDKNGKAWRWEYRPRFGVDFVRRDGQFLKHQPAKNFPGWELFDKWLEEKGL